jgi:RNA polymerase sigma-54 factor
MLLLPRMLQSIEVLQLPALELEGWLRDAAESNEALVLEDPRSSPEGAAVEAEPGPGASGSEPGDGTWGGDEGWQRPRGTREDSERHDQMLRNQPAREGGPVEHLEQQLVLLDLEPRQAAWTRLLIQCLDESGLLSLPDETLLALGRDAGLEADPARLAEAISILQGLEPRGIGARNAIHALVLQLDPEDPEYELLVALLEGFLEEVAKNKLPGVARAMGLRLPELTALLERLRELDPRPGASLGARPAPPIHPEVLVEGVGPPGGPDETFEVRVDSSLAPTVSIDPRVLELARDREQPAEVRRYLRDKVDRARWVVSAVEQRGATLARIAALLFEHQHDFLRRGPGHLVPLRMNRLADELEVHVSTVSRAVAGKYAQTPWGIFPLRHFFQASTGGEGADPGGPGLARDGVREEVRAVFDGEDRLRPLSDDEVVAELGRRGIDLARRTVAKYRKELGIPSSYRRRVYE